MRQDFAVPPTQSDPDITQSASSRGLDRRTMIKRAAAVGAVAWTAPVMLDSLASPAAALTSCVTFSSSTPGTYSVNVPANCAVKFTIVGGGGAGGGSVGTGVG